MDRLSILCFAGTYGLAILGELSRFAFRSQARWFATLGLAVLGWVVHTAYLVNQIWREPQFPIATQFDFMLVLSWVFAAIAVYLMARMPRGVSVGLFVLPVAVALSALAAVSGGGNRRADWAQWMPLWGAVHGWFLTLGAVLTCLAFVAGLMYLAQSRRLKRKSPPQAGLKLPSLEQSERLNRLAITLAFPFLTFGLLIGVVLNGIGAPDAAGPVLRWSDPKILSAAAMWVVFAILLHARFRPEMRGRRVMILSVVAFGFLLFTMVGVNLLLTTAHGVPAATRRLP
jgi:ABC-type transport system involved in cytochrome c biogenesis permease subunit